MVCLLLWKSREILDLTSATAGLHSLHTGSTVLHGFLPLACLSCARPGAPHTPSADHDRLHGPAGLLRHHLGEGGGGGDCEAGEAGGGGGGDGGGQGARGFGARGFGWSEGPGSPVGHPALDRGSELSGGSIIFFSPMQYTNLFGLLILANLTSSSKFAGSVISTVRLTGLCILTMVELKLCSLNAD